ncbi:MAG: hypothetical protein KJ954_00065, partial [Alphaproteobacteria bacterium]|nr:hypothetical protein [Alphaproteobacteria bacterium]
KYVFVELSFIPLYKDAPLAHEVMAWMQNQGFEVISFIPGFSDLARARMLQADVLFARRDVPPPQ